MQRFPDGARVCFVGDSITHNGMFVAHVVAYYREHFRGSRVEFYNCGIAGGGLSNTIKIYGEDIAIYEPTHIVLMTGVNDSRRSLLINPASRERYEALTEAYREYKKNVDTFYKMTKERGIALTLCTPVPFAEYAAETETPIRGAYALILGYADFIRGFARDNGIPLCDYHAALTEVMQTEGLYMPDAVHPTSRGHYYMAKTFLAHQGLDLGEERPLPADIADWLSTAGKLRNVVATEYFMVPDYTEKARPIRIAEISRALAEAEAGAEISPYFLSLMREYTENEAHRDEYVQEVKNFMKQG